MLPQWHFPSISIFLSVVLSLVSARGVGDAFPRVHEW
jgi:hypothetical protein